MAVGLFLRGVMRIRVALLHLGHTTGEFSHVEPLLSPGARGTAERGLPMNFSLAAIPSANLTFEGEGNFVGRLV